MSKELIQNEDFQTVVSSENGIYTIRSLDPNAQENSDVGDDYQEIDVPIVSLPDGCFDLDNLPKFATLQELLDNLCEVMIRFDTSPKNLLKSDYEQLVKTVTNGLIYLYTSGAAGGDMLKMVYDPNDDGIVTKALQDALGNVIDQTYLKISNLKSALGISQSGSSSKFLNEQGDFTEVNGSKWEDASTVKNDWYLPSKLELEKLYLSNTFTHTYLASSSEGTYNSTYGYYTFWKLRSDGGFQEDIKSFHCEILPIRSFTKTETSASLSIGNTGEAGVIFYYENNGTSTKYLEHANKAYDSYDLSFAWSNINSSTITPVPQIGTSNALFTGLANSNAIVNQSGHTMSAAKFCLDYVNPIKIKPKNGNTVDATYINSASDKNFITDSQKTNLHTHSNKSALDNVSGTNTGDQDIQSELGINTVDGSEQKFLNEKGLFSTISIGGGGSAPLYYNPTASDISGYKTLSYTPYATEVETSYVLSTSETLLTSFMYPFGIATTVIDAGTWLSKVMCKISSANGTSTLRLVFSMYKDGVKTELFSAISTEINNADNADYAILQGDSVQQVFTVDSAARLTLDIYGITTGSNKTIYFKIGGTNVSFIQTPLKTRHSELRDLNGDSNYQHFDSTSEKTTPVNSDSLGLWDSVTSTFKRLSISNFLTYLRGFFVGKLCFPYAIDSAVNDATAGENKIVDSFPVNFTLTDVYVNLKSIPAEGLKFTVDVKKNGVSIFSTLITIDSTEDTSKTASVPYVLATYLTTFLKTDKVSIDIVQVGSTTAGKLPILYFIGYETI